MKNKKINITKTYLPNLDKYKSYVDKIYQSGQITNNGPLVQELEKKLKEYLNVKNIVLVANGTLALQVAYKVLNLTGDVITTPFSFVATTSSIVSSGLNPLFSDINPRTYNIDPNIINKIITKKTSAIVPVHTYGNACEIEEIQKIANQYNLKVIYDACHAFDVQYKGENILNHGDISTLSFHATKLFHTIEGGALIIQNDDLAMKARNIINFGINSGSLKYGSEIDYVGINAKMNEFEAAMGLCVLDDMKFITKKRKAVYARYEQELNKSFKLQEKNINSSNNYTYFTILIESEKKII